MAHGIHFMKTGCTSKISQTSGFQKHIQKKLTCLFLSLRANSKNPVCLDWPCIAWRNILEKYYYFPLHKCKGYFHREERYTRWHLFINRLINFSPMSPKLVLTYPPGDYYGTTIFVISFVKTSLQSIKIFVKLEFFLQIFWLFHLFLFTLNFVETTADSNRKELTFWF